jgi:hypothetical protein
MSIADVNLLDTEMMPSKRFSIVLPVNKKVILFSRLNELYRIVGYVEENGFDAGIAIIDFFSQNKLCEFNMKFIVTDKMHIKFLKDYSPLKLMERTVVMISLLTRGNDKSNLSEIFNFVKNFLESKPTNKEITKIFSSIFKHELIMHPLEKQYAIDVLNDLKFGKTYDYEYKK